jgi:hypothetical protein
LSGQASTLVDTPDARCRKLTCSGPGGGAAPGGSGGSLTQASLGERRVSTSSCVGDQIVASALRLVMCRLTSHGIAAGPSASLRGSR